VADASSLPPTSRARGLDPLPWVIVVGWSLLAIPLLIAGPAIATFVGYANLPRPRAKALLVIGLLIGVAHLLIALFAPQVILAVGGWLYDSGITKVPPPGHPR
jgi:hypothetical protein